MNRLMLAATLLFSVAAQAGQVTSSTARCSKEQFYYGKSDSLCWGRASDYQNEPLFAEDGNLGVRPASFYLDFTTQGDGKEIKCLGQGNVAWATTTLLTQTCSTTKGFMFNVGNIGVQTTPPDMDAASLDIGGAQTDDIGMRLYTGRGYSTHREFAVGTDGAFFTCATVAVEAVEGTDDFHVGFMEPQVDVVATNGIADYVNYYSVGWNGNEDPQNFETEYGTTEAIVDMGDEQATDSEANKLCVFVSAAGVCTASVNGGTEYSCGTLTDGLLVAPFIYQLQDSSLTGEIDVTIWEAGFGDSTKQTD